MFLDYYLRKYGNKNNYKEIIRVFNFSCIIKLKNHLSKNYKYNHNYRKNFLKKLEKLNLFFNCI